MWARLEWPEFRQYARQKYPDELDEDLITMIEDLIERRRQRRYGKRDSWAEVKNLDRVAEIFDVPKPVMGIRLRQLGLI